VVRLAEASGVRGSATSFAMQMATLSGFHVRQWEPTAQWGRPRTIRPSLSMT
jgi:hypothetical protein